MAFGRIYVAMSAMAAIMGIQNALFACLMNVMLAIISMGLYERFD